MLTTQVTVNIGILVRRFVVRLFLIFFGRWTDTLQRNQPLVPSQVLHRRSQECMPGGFMRSLFVDFDFDFDFGIASFNALLSRNVAPLRYLPVELGMPLKLEKPQFSPRYFECLKS